MQTLPVVARAVAPILDELTLRHPVEDVAQRGHALRASVKHILIAGVIGGPHAPAPRNPRADHFAGIALQGSSRFAERLVECIDHLPAGTTELMVHPGYADDTLRSVDRCTAMREAELAAHLSAEFRQRLLRGHLTLVAGRADRPAA